MEKCTYDVTCQGREGSLEFDRFHFFFYFLFGRRRGKKDV